MTYITGDTHRDFTRIFRFCERLDTTKEDIMIILGDAGINYLSGERDVALKKELSELPITLFCIHGNHEMRPQRIPSYLETQWHGGTVYVEPDYPNLLFGKDGEVYDIAGQSCLVLGGAYSVDKYFRLMRGYGWWDDEQPSPKIKESVAAKLRQIEYRIDVVLSHTTPSKYEPVEVFLQGIDQNGVDKSTEEWLDDIEAKLSYKKWYCGHYHTEKEIDKITFLFESIQAFK